MALIPKSLFPNVPKLPGVPQLRRSPQFPAGPPPILGIALALGRLWQALFSQPEWAIYKQVQPASGAPRRDSDGTLIVDITRGADDARQAVVKPDSFLEFGYRNEYSISDYPVQAGGFASYDKVNNPYEIVLRMSKGGSKQERKQFIDSLDNIVGTLELYDILTPEKVFIGVNVLRYEIARRGNRAAYFFTEVDLYFREIRTVTATYSSTAVTTEDAQDPSAAPVSNIGTVQGQPTTATPAGVGVPP
jgi:hypothetical protein